MDWFDLMLLMTFAPFYMYFNNVVVRSETTAYLSNQFSCSWVFTLDCLSFLCFLFNFILIFTGYSRSILVTYIMRT